MTAPRTAATATAAAAAVIAVVLLSTRGSDTPRLAGPAVLAERAPAPSSGKPPRGVIVNCSRRSEANFRAAADSRNLVVGPLILVGGGVITPASVVRKFGGNKFPLLVKAGHTVTVRLSRPVQRSAGLAYAGLGRRRLPQGQVRLRDTADTMTFVACQPGGPSGSHAGREQITFWSGFFLTRTPICLPLEVYVDDDPAPRRVGLALGRRC